MPDQLFTDPIQMTWTPIKGRDKCRRDPEAGPGTCYHWWDGCPDAEKRGCYFQWSEQHRKAGHIRLSATQAGVSDA